MWSLFLQTLPVVVAVSVVVVTVLYFILRGSAGEKKKKQPVTLQDPMVKYSLPLTHKQVGCIHTFIFSNQDFFFCWLIHIQSWLNRKLIFNCYVIDSVQWGDNVVSNRSQIVRSALTVIFHFVFHPEGKHSRWISRKLANHRPQPAAKCKEKIEISIEVTWSTTPTARLYSELPVWLESANMLAARLTELTW